MPLFSNKTLMSSNIKRIKDTLKQAPTSLGSYSNVVGQDLYGGATKQIAAQNGITSGINIPLDKASGILNSSNLIGNPNDPYKGSSLISKRTDLKSLTYSNPNIEPEIRSTKNSELKNSVASSTSTSTPARTSGILGKATDFIGKLTRATTQTPAGIIRSTKDDVNRIGKFLVSPKGIKWGVTQVGLQLSNPVFAAENARRFAFFSGNTYGNLRQYTPLNSLLQVAGVGFGLHLNRHGIVPINVPNIGSLVSDIIQTGLQTAPVKNSLGRENLYYKLQYGLDKQTPKDTHLYRLYEKHIGANALANSPNYYSNTRNRFPLATQKRNAVQFAKRFPNVQTSGRRGQRIGNFIRRVGTGIGNAARSVANFGLRAFETARFLTKNAPVFIRRLEYNVTKFVDSHRRNPILYTYLGGPGSLYGIGRTTIFKASVQLQSNALGYDRNEFIKTANERYLDLNSFGFGDLSSLAFHPKDDTSQQQEYSFKFALNPAYIKNAGVVNSNIRLTTILPGDADFGTKNTLLKQNLINLKNSSTISSFFGEDVKFITLPYAEIVNFDSNAYNKLILFFDEKLNTPKLDNIYFNAKKELEYPKNLSTIYKIDNTLLLTSNLGDFLTFDHYSLEKYNNDPANVSIGIKPDFREYILDSFKLNPKTILNSYNKGLNKKLNNIIGVSTLLKAIPRTSLLTADNTAIFNSPLIPSVLIPSEGNIVFNTNKNKLNISNGGSISKGTIYSLPTNTFIEDFRYTLSFNNTPKGIPISDYDTANTASTEPSDLYILSPEYQELVSTQQNLGFGLRRGSATASLDFKGLHAPNVSPMNSTYAPFLKPLIPPPAIDNNGTYDIKEQFDFGSSLARSKEIPYGFMSFEQIKAISRTSRSGSNDNVSAKINYPGFINAGTNFQQPQGGNPMTTRTLSGDPGVNSKYYRQQKKKPSQADALVDGVTGLPLFVLQGQAINNRKIHNDLVKFHIQAIDNDAPEQGVMMTFRAFIDSFNDDYSAGWNPYKYIGRGEKFYTYNDFTRTINVSFKIVALSRCELPRVYQKLSYLASNLAPDYYLGGRIRGPMTKLTVGDYISYQPGIITSLRYTIPKESSWEIAIEDNNTDPNIPVKEYPHLVEVDMTFIPVHDFLPRKSTINKITPFAVNDYDATGKRGNPWLINQIFPNAQAASNEKCAVIPVSITPTKPTEPVVTSVPQNLPNEDPYATPDPTVTVIPVTPNPAPTPAPTPTPTPVPTPKPAPKPAPKPKPKPKPQPKPQPQPKPKPNPAPQTRFPSIKSSPVIDNTSAGRIQSHGGFGGF